MLSHWKRDNGDETMYNEKEVSMVDEDAGFEKYNSSDFMISMEASRMVVWMEWLSKDMMNALILSGVK